MLDSLLSNKCLMVVYFEQNVADIMAVVFKVPSYTSAYVHICLYAFVHVGQGSK